MSNNQLDLMKEELLYILMQEELDSFSVKPINKDYSIDKELILSFSQQRFWLINQLYPDSSNYNIPFFTKIFGALNSSIMISALKEVIARHDILRTNFIIRDDKPIQVVSSEVNVDFSLIDLRDLNVDEKKVSVQNILKEVVDKTYDLARDPLFRVKILCLEDNEYILAFAMHHIISDGWSIGIFIKEVMSLYSAFINNLPSPLSDLPCQYADFAIWEKEKISGRYLEEGLSYWKDKLKNAPLSLFPTDRLRPAIQTSHGAVRKFLISEEIAAVLHQLNLENNTTLYMSLFSIFNLLMYKYSGQKDICIGTPIANRANIEIEPLIGCFINTLVLRTQIDDNLYFSEYLEEVRRSILEAYKYQDIPFDIVVQAVESERNLSYSPLFQVLFVLQNNDVAINDFQDLKLEKIQIENNHSQFDLTLSITEEDKKLEAY
ncbi:non-ribosomal peptide synthetase, partial [Acinetobacter pittii]